MGSASNGSEAKGHERQPPGGDSEAPADSANVSPEAGGGATPDTTPAAGAEASLTSSESISTRDFSPWQSSDRVLLRIVTVLLMAVLVYVLRDALSPVFLTFGVLLLVTLSRHEMRFEHAMGVVAVVLFGGWLVHEISGLLWPFALSFVLAYLLAPLVDLLEPRLTRTGASLLVMVVLVGILVSTGVLLIPQVIGEVRDLVNRMPVYQRTVSALLQRVLSALQAHGYEISVSEIQDRVLDRLPEVSNLVATQTIALLRGVSSGVTALVNVGIIPFVAFYIVKDYHKINSAVHGLFPRRHTDTASDLMGQVSRVIGQYFRGQLIVCAFLAVFTSLGLAVLQIRYAIILGVLAGVSNLVPYVGYAVALGVAAIVALMEPEPIVSLLKVVAVFITVQAAEGNLVTPRVVGSRIGLHPVWVVFALMVAAHFWGFLGMLVALPVAAVINILVRILAQSYFGSGYYRAEGGSQAETEKQS